MSQNIASVENPNEVACRTRCAAEQRASEMAEAAAVEAKARAELDKLSNSVAAKGSIKGRASAAATALAEATRALSVATAEKAKALAQRTVMAGVRAHDATMEHPRREQPRGGQPQRGAQATANDARQHPTCLRGSQPRATRATASVQQTESWSESATPQRRGEAL